MRRLSRWSLLCCGMAALAAAASPPPAGRPFAITRLDPALDRIVAPNARAQLISDRFGLVKGLQWVNDGAHGYLIVSDLISNVLYKVAADGTIGAFLTKAGYTGKDATHTGTQTMRGRAFVILIGSSCTMLTPEGRLAWCANNDRTLMRLEPDGRRTVLAGGAEGRRFSGPNSIAIRTDSGIYLTDNDFGLRDAGANPDKQMPNAVWLLREGHPPVKVIGADALGGIPDGIALSPDEKWLYLSAGDTLKRYPVQADGTLGGGTVFAQGDGIGDGIAIDTNGTVFSTGGFGRGRVRIMASSGTLLGFLELPVFGGEPARRICSDNVAFGGFDGKTLYIAACQAVYRLGLRTPGPIAGPRGIVHLPEPRTP